MPAGGAAWYPEVGTDPEAGMAAMMNSLGLDGLSRDERVSLANELLDSVVDEVGPRLTETKRRELADRVAHLKAHPDDVVSWDEVEALARVRFAQ